MPKNVAVLLYVFAALSLVSKLGGGIDQIAYAQLPPYSPPIENQNQNANNAIQPSNDLPLNNNAIQPSNGRSSTSSNCMVTSSGAGGDISMSSSTLSMRTTNCGGTQHSLNSCPVLEVTNDVGFIVPRAEIVSIPPNVIKAVSIPPIVTGTIPISITKGNVTPTATIISQVQEICGTNRDDYIIGSEGGNEGDDIIFGLRGNDIITALGGDDQVFGGPGDDIVYGGDGNNQLFGQDGNDNLVGGTQDDLIVGGPGNDRLYGNTGDDILQGGPGADYFDCGDGVDTVVDYNSAQGDIVSVNCENVNSVHGNPG